MRAIVIGFIILTSVIVSAAPARALAGIPSLVDERPAADSMVGTSYPQIYARFADTGMPVDPASVQLSVDGADATAAATISSVYVSYIPQYGMSVGRHTVSISGSGADGTTFSDAWTFWVDSGNASDVGSLFDNEPGSYGYPRYGFYPPGFSLFSPGPIYLVAGGVIRIVFLSPFFPYGNGFVTIGGFPGQYPLVPWAGCPGYFWVRVPVPFGVLSRNAVIAAHFTTPAGGTVIVHSTAPLHIDGMTRTLPHGLHYSNVPMVIDHPLTAGQFSSGVARSPSGPSWPLLVSSAPPRTHIPSPGSRATIIYPGPPANPHGNASAPHAGGPAPVVPQPIWVKPQQ